MVFFTSATVLVTMGEHGKELTEGKKVIVPMTEASSRTSEIAKTLRRSKSTI